ncbi:hypothetical protein XELAEV_18002457mg [Xenopus laevis]|nr:hypothetical protein XELAEV_18002457mg [Xenopus laevis]
MRTTVITGRLLLANVAGTKVQPAGQAWIRQLRNGTPQTHKQNISPNLPHPRSCLYMMKQKNLLHGVSLSAQLLEGGGIYLLKGYVTNQMT